METTKPSLPNPKTAALLHGLKSAFAPACLVLIITFFAFGALVRATDLPLSFGLAATAFVFAIPGQVVLVDEIAQNAAPWAIFFSVMLTAVRLLPLTLSLMPLLNQTQSPKALKFFIAHFVAVTVWLQTSQTLPKLPPVERGSYCVGLCLGLLAATLLATSAGFIAGGHLPPSLMAAALMATPIYFLISLIETSTCKTDQRALILGALLAVPLSLYWPEMALIGAGIIGGTLAYASTKNKKETK